MAQVTGGKIDKSYSPGVLIGNWSEDRHRFEKGAFGIPNSTHRTDFIQYGSYQPDVIVRRDNQFKSTGLSAEFLFHHHGDKYLNNMNTWYEEYYNVPKPKPIHRQLRNYNFIQSAWLPEKSDHPYQGPPIRYGLREKLDAGAIKQITSTVHGDFNTTYNTSYIPHNSGEYVSSRYYVPRARPTALPHIGCKIRGCKCQQTVLAPGELITITQKPQTADAGVTTSCDYRPCATDKGSLTACQA